MCVSEYWPCVLVSTDPACEYWPCMLVSIDPVCKWVLTLRDYWPCVWVSTDPACMWVLTLRVWACRGGSARVRACGPDGRWTRCWWARVRWPRSCLPPARSRWNSRSANTHKSRYSLYILTLIYSLQVRQIFMSFHNFSMSVFTFQFLSANMTGAKSPLIYKYWYCRLFCIIFLWQNSVMIKNV